MEEWREIFHGYIPMGSDNALNGGFLFIRFLLNLLSIMVYLGK